MSDGVTRLGVSLCPHCGYKLDAATSLTSNRRPSPGDWTVCMECTGLLVFDVFLRPGVAPPGLFEADCKTNWDLRPNILRIQREITRMWAKHPRKKPAIRGH